MKTIQHITNAKFKVNTQGVENSELILDFQPIIDKFKLTGDFKLIHWQARPKGHREFGIYSSVDDSYRSTDNLSKAGYGSVQFLQLDDATANTLPSAVILHRGNLK
ncbi:MAG: hypothetical protein KME09_14715 [Pleurocapsa minor HA4230-MV1]|jgi:hypothetical protein|nr:hypothetical protein [Pleurocapsa minor HA4230-MV1]